MAYIMVKVIKKCDLLILTLFDYSLGELFLNDGDRYEGEFKDDVLHGKGKKEVIYLLIYWF